MTRALAFLAGLMFAAGLAVAGMTRPAKVIAFLDVLGDWDPSLSLVMLGAIAVYMPLYRWATRLRTPLLAPSFSLPTRRDIDPGLITGAALFGVGWGLSGYCPGPAVASLGFASGASIVFVVAMIAGMIAFAALERAVREPG